VERSDFWGAVACKANATQPQTGHPNLVGMWPVPSGKQFDGDVSREWSRADILPGRHRPSRQPAPRRLRGARRLPSIRAGPWPAEIGLYNPAQVHQRSGGGV